MTRRKFRNAVQGTLLLLCIYIAFSGAALANLQVKVVGRTASVWPESVCVDLESWLPFAEKFSTIDPNFQNQGVTDYKGIRISKLMEMAGENPDSGVTIIGSDQYVGYLPGQSLDKGFLVWEMAGRPISRLKGGPLKIMFKEDAGMHTSCYTWYVEALVAGPVDQAVLGGTFGHETREFKRSDLLPHAVKLNPYMLSIAQGCRNKFEDQSSAQTIRAVPLAYFLSAQALEKGIQAIHLIPFAGPKVSLGPDILDYPVFVLVSRNNRFLHPALGGPFSVVFPVEKYPELEGRVPESGALFFLERIVIN